MGAVGIEPVADSPGNTHVAGESGTPSGTVVARNGASDGVGDAPADVDLHQLVTAWPSLPPAVKAGIVAMVKAATGH